MKINFKTIPQKLHRYDTIGDYWYDKKSVLQVRVTEMDKRSEFLVLIHELIEQFLTEERGIKEEDIMNFDLEFENKLVPELAQLTLVLVTYCLNKVNLFYMDINEVAH